MVGILSKLFGKKKKVQKTVCDIKQRVDFEPEKINSWFADFINNGNLKYLPIDNMRLVIYNCYDEVISEYPVEQLIANNIQKGGKPYFVTLKTVDTGMVTRHIHEVAVYLDIHYRGCDGNTHKCSFNIGVVADIHELAKVCELVGFCLDFLEESINKVVNCIGCNIVIPKPHELRKSNHETITTTLKEYISFDGLDYRTEKFDDTFITKKRPLSSIEKAFINDKTHLDQTLTDAVYVSPIRKRNAGILMTDEEINSIELPPEEDVKGTVAEWFVKSDEEVESHN